MWPFLFWPLGLLMIRFEDDPNAAEGPAPAPAVSPPTRRAIPPRRGRRWPAIATAEACKPVANLAVVREVLKGNR